MNYLAHAYLSFGDPGLLAGNMIADHVKGRAALEQLPEGIQKGVQLHRFIDRFADVHPAVQRAMILFRPAYRLYAAPIVDVVMDHFLANDPKLFANEGTLLAFTEDAYRKLDESAVHFPESFRSFFQYMKRDNWLYNYRTQFGTQKSLGGLFRRASYMPSPDTAYAVFIGNYYYLNQCYLELIEATLPAVKMELNEQSQNVEG